MKQILFFVFLAILFSSCKNSGEYKKVMHDPLLYSQTVHELNNIVMGNNFTPVVASRNYTYANIAAYEVVAAGENKHYTSLAGQLHGLKSVPKPAANNKIDFPFAALLAYAKWAMPLLFPKAAWTITWHR